MLRACARRARNVTSSAANARAIARARHGGLGAEEEELAYAPKTHTRFEPTEPTFMTVFTLARNEAATKMESAEAQERHIARLIGMLGGSLKSFYVTQTGDHDGVVIYAFPKNHDSRTFTCLLRQSLGTERECTTKLMSSGDAATSARAAREVMKRLK